MYNTYMMKRNQSGNTTFAILSIYVLIVLTTSGEIKAQNFGVSVYMEKTPVDLQISVSMGYDFQSGFGAGAFMQQNITRLMNETGSKSEGEFVGIYSQFTVIKDRKVQLIFRIRSGLLDQKNFKITPSIHLKHKINNHVFIGVGLGARNLTPTISPLLTILLKDRKIGKKVNE